MVYRTEVKLWLENDAGTFLISKGKAELLRRIDETGSLSAAARQMGMSYRHAWGLVRKMEEALGTKAVLSIRGGMTRGHSTLTDNGRKLLEFYRIHERALEEYSRNGPWPRPVAVLLSVHGGKVLMIRDHSSDVWSLPTAPVKMDAPVESVLTGLLEEVGLGGIRIPGEFRTLVRNGSLHIIARLEAGSSAPGNRKGIRHGLFDSSSLPECTETDRSIVKIFLP